MRPSGFSARATTGAQARANGERAEFAPAPNLQNETAPGPDGYDDGGAPIGPSEEEEAAFLANEGADASSHFSGGASESSTRSLGTASLARAENDEKVSGPLPSLEELRAKISPEVLGLMEELFRAKLTRVSRVPAKVLKQQQDLSESQ